MFKINKNPAYEIVCPNYYLIISSACKLWQ